MNNPPPSLADRKALLLARSSLHRLQLSHEADALRESLNWRNLASSAASSGAMRPLAIGAIILIAGRKRISSLVRLATGAIMVVKVVRTLLGRDKAP